MPAIGILILLAVLQEPRFEARADVSWVGLRGGFRFDEKPQQGDRMDAAARGTSHLVSVAWNRTDELWEAAYRTLQVDGSQSPDHSLRFNETLFPIGEEIRSMVTLRELFVRHERRVSSTEGWAWYGTLRICHRLLEPEYESDSLGADADHLGTLSVEPGIRVVKALGRGFDALARFEGTWHRFGDHAVRGLAGSVSVTWTAGTAVALSSGWRAETLRLVNIDSEQRNEASLRVGGAFLELQVRF